MIALPDAQVRKAADGKGRLLAITQIPKAARVRSGGGAQPLREQGANAFHKRSLHGSGRVHQAASKTVVPA